MPLFAPVLSLLCSSIERVMKRFQSFYVFKPVPYLLFPDPTNKFRGGKSRSVMLFLPNFAKSPQSPPFHYLTILYS